MDLKIELKTTHTRPDPLLQNNSKPVILLLPQIGNV